MLKKFLKSKRMMNQIKKMMSVKITFLLINSIWVIKFKVKKMRMNMKRNQINQRSKLISNRIVMKIWCQNRSLKLMMKIRIWMIISKKRKIVSRWRKRRNSNWFINKFVRILRKVQIFLINGATNMMIKWYPLMDQPHS